MAKTMYIMRGLPGSGKSTKACDVQCEHIADLDPDVRKAECPVILSSDEYFTVGGVYYFDVTKLGSAHRWNQWRARQLIAAGRNIIIDNTNTTFKEFKCYVENALAAGYEVVIVEADTPWAKDVDGLLEHGTHSVPRATVEKMLERYEDKASIEEKLQKLKEKYLN